MDEYVRGLLRDYPPYRFANSPDGRTCSDCGKQIGLRENECTGWHPAFKCDCGYETSHPAAATWTNCIHCGKSAENILDADVVE